MRSRGNRETLAALRARMRAIKTSASGWRGEFHEFGAQVLLERPPGERRTRGEFEQIAGRDDRHQGGGLGTAPMLKQPFRK